MGFTTRPTLRGYGGAVSAGHYLATQIGIDFLARGANAADAACAMGFALQVLEPHMNGPAGEDPILFYDAGEDRVHVISGQCVATGAATIDRFTGLGFDRIPGSGLLAATVPAAMDAWCHLLERFGTRSFEAVSSPARALAAKGFPMYPFLRGVLGFLEPSFRDAWPSSGEVYLPIPEIGSRQKNPAYAGVLVELMVAERAARGTREQGIRAARNAFYEGRVAEEIDRFLREPAPDQAGRLDAGLLVAQDLADYQGRIEEPVYRGYRGATVWKCGPWTQGPVFLQQLALLEGFDLSSMGPRTPDSLHTLIECAKLAFADRESCYGDPLFAEIPIDELIGDAYANERRALVDSE